MLYELLLVLFLFLVGVAAVRITRTTMSRFELERRAESGDDEAKRLLEREAALADILSLQRALIALLIIFVTIVSLLAFGWVVGVLVALGISLSYGVVSRRQFVNRFVQKAYTNIEPNIIGWVAKVPFIFAILRSVTVEQSTDPEVRSKEQLLYLINHSHDVLTQEQKILFRQGLIFSDKKVSDIMTPRSVIDSITASELLGPLVLDDLHKTGHSRFPVVDGDIDHIVGMLYIRDLLVLDAGKRSSTVRKAMEPRVFYIHQEQTLEHALAAFLKSHHHLFVVVNEYRETVGLLSLEDVMEVVLGRKIIDEFDAHEDLRTVASRNPRGNNDPQSHTDV